MRNDRNIIGGIVFLSTGYVHDSRIFIMRRDTKISQNFCNSHRDEYKPAKYQANASSYLTVKTFQYMLLKYT